ncbi:16S rRNA (guanine(966)-N(2))-methyltransferase RsmD [Eubacterium xylanophilum]|uniref:16S rRNA (guanine(966)-N(2))-methyltransferase RsmD n=1 Tax=Eubacterium xylanophilum TaxID=39497 RepID=UPI00047EAD54|nr:16S rRNA (guanine(966)-N(2))-methyltransferase RsmD [Eubacterium xylanophilum]MCR5796487.1 16S rRNA (guanine(966)-N(2))-methyltransferase RsmD [Eubacterium sp.]
MRVIAGKARRIPLVTAEGKDTRPTTDRIKETLFNIIQDDVPGAMFLDLFSGSGAIGIEALSRGAKKAYLVEFAREPLKCIKANLQKTRLEEDAVVLPIEATYSIAKLGNDGIKFDIIYADPPYRSGFEEKIVDLIAHSNIVKEDTLVIIESALETEVDYIDDSLYEVVKIKEYKTNKHIFLRVR